MLLVNASHLIIDDLGQWHSIAYSPRKMIRKLDIKNDSETHYKIQYKTHNSELLAIIEAFKT